MKTHKPWCETDLRLARQAAAFLTSKLHTWYEQQRRLGHRPSEVEYLTATMFGTKKKPVTKLKGAETEWLFRFVTSCFLPDRCHDLRRGAELRMCAETLLEYVDFLAAQPDVPGGDACNHLERLCLKHLVQCEPSELKYRPKHHLFWHMTQRTCRDSGKRAGVSTGNGCITE